MDSDKDCLFCLLDKPSTKKNISPCECTPFLHQRCLNKWYSTNPNSCPICRINYEDIGIKEEKYEEHENIQDHINDNRAKRFALSFIFMYICFNLIRYYIVA